MKLKKGSSIFFLLNILVIVNMIYTISFFAPYEDFSKNIVEKKPNPSNYFELDPFVIPNDYTWAQAAMQPWCSGAGTENNPYIISNVKIDAQNQIIRCLSIESTSVFFQIKNSIFYNSESGGIRLNNVQNGQLLNNTCYNNHYGISVGNSNNISMESNNVKGNYYGIGIYSTDNSELLDTTIINSYTAIDFMYSDYNFISGCVMRNNSYGGGLDMYESFNNEITFNSFSYNDPAIELTRCDYNTFDQNTLTSNENAGIQFFQSSYNIFTKNTIRDHSTAILLSPQSNENTIRENIMIDNIVCIRDNGEDNIISGNTCLSMPIILMLISVVIFFINALISLIVVFIVKKRKKKRRIRS